MKIAVKTIEGGSAGEIDLADAVFAVPVRKDILHRCVVWQLSRRQQGTHKTKGRAEVTATAKKMYAQKGTGRARHGNEAAPQFRGGGKAFGPVVRSHASDLPKKVRKLALRSALSAKAAEGKLIMRRCGRPGRAEDGQADGPFRQARHLERADHRRRRGRHQLRARGVQHRPHRRAAAAGRQRLRHPAPRHAGADQAMP